MGKKNIGYSINHQEKTVKMSAAFMKASSEFGSKEYNIMKSLRSDFPSYTFCKMTKSNAKANRLNYEQIEVGIKAHFPEYLDEFYHYRDATEETDGGKTLHVYRFVNIRAWYVLLLKGTHTTLRPQKPKDINVIEEVNITMEAA